jgi:hypothetical protein
MVFVMVTLNFKNVSDSDAVIVQAKVAKITPIEGQTGDPTIPWAAGYSLSKFCYNCDFVETLFPGEQKQLAFFYSVFYDGERTHTFIFQYENLPPIIFSFK